MFKLVIQDDEGKTTVVPLVRDEITIGRKEGNTIRLTERNVSRKHARISRANGAVAIEDLGSYNGVRVNGTRISQRTVLAVSDRVQIGDYLIELKAEGVEQPVPYEDARTQPIERLDPAQLAAAMPGAAPAAPAMGVPLGLADTDPTARAVQPGAMAAPGSYARIVVLSSNFAGREFQLTKQEMVIGRTDDNDVVINHRSISRNHAKIVREPGTGRYTIMDLQSSNGVRVNGEDYGKVELRRGDTIDLGHVRFRFIEPGEDFVFGRDAQIVDVPTGKSKSWIFALLGLVVVGGVVVVVAGGGGGGKKKTTEVADKGGTGSADPAMAAGTNPGATGGGSATNPDNPGGSGGSAAVQPPDLGTGTGSGPGTDTAPVPPPTGSGTGSSGGTAPSGSGDVAAMLADAHSAIDNSKWSEAIKNADKVLEADPGNAEARTLADQAKRELQNSMTYSDFATAVQRKQYEDAVAKFEQIPQDSVYKNKARDAYDRLHTQFLSDSKRQAQSLAKAHKCKDLDKLATEAGKVFSDAGAEVRSVACDEAVASHNPGGGDGSGSGGGSSGGGSPPPSGDPAQLVQEAGQAAVNSQYARALSLAAQVMKMPNASPPLVTKAVTIAALSACNLKDQAKAKMYFARASSASKMSIRQTCLRVAKFDPGAE